MKCFLCKEKSIFYFTVKLLIAHIKSAHVINNIKYFKCIEEDCLQQFSNLYTYKRHIVRVHEKEKNNSKNNTIIEQQRVEIVNSAEYISITEKHLCQDQCSNIIEQNCSIRATSCQQTCISDNYLENLTGLTFVLSLHNNNNFNRKNVLDIIKEIETKVTNPLAGIISKQILPLIENSKNKVLAANILDQIMHPFQSIETEYTFLRELESRGVFKKPIFYTINEEICEIILNHSPTLASNKVTGIIMPLEFQFKKYFESQNILQLTLENTERLSKCPTGSYENLINGEIWKRKIEHFEGKLTIPFVLFFDDFCIDNPLGSHAKEQSVCGVYYTFPTIPKNQISKLNNIFVAGFFKTKDISSHGNFFSIKPFINQIKNLETLGIEIEVGSKIYQIHFILAFVVGDNLGLNTYLGFSPSFNSNFYCRACKRNKSQMQSDIKEYENSLRNIENYITDVIINNEKLTGIKENCVFNEIDSFHVTYNFYFDIMHDLFEGVCKYDLTKILVNYIETSKYFTLDILNYRKQMFDYGETEIGNISPPFVLSTLKRDNLKMTARETMTFVNYLPLMIGDLIPEGDKLWDLLIVLIKIVDIVLLPHINEINIKNLEYLVSKHNSLYMKLFNEPLKPKFHFLLHYPTAIRKCGPLRHLWCMRFESLHKLNKTAAKATNSRVNIPFTLAIKAGLKFSHLLLNQIFFVNELTFQEANLCICNLHLLYKKIDNCSINIHLSEATCAQNVKFRGKTYKKHFYLTKSDRQSVLLYEIEQIILHKSELLFLCRQWYIDHFSEHFQAYIVSTHNNSFSLHHVHEFDGTPIHLHLIKNGKKAFRLKKN